MTRNLTVCVSPSITDLFELDGKIAVIVDILRSTSCITAGMASGIEEIVPVATLEECQALKNQGYYGSAERNGNTVEGFDFGNSPFSYMDPKYKGQKIAATTTNGTLAISKAKAAKEIIIGSFLNLDSVANYLRGKEEDVVMICSGWKGDFCLEDTLFCGALLKKLGISNPEQDAALMALLLYKSAKDDLLAFLKQSSHFKRLAGKGILKDIEFCLQENVYDVLPIMQGDKVVIYATETVSIEKI